MKIVGQDEDIFFWDKKNISDFCIICQIIMISFLKDIVKKRVHKYKNAPSERN